jgi:hypothetical protein
MPHGFVYTSNKVIAGYGFFFFHGGHVKYSEGIFKKMSLRIPKNPKQSRKLTSYVMYIYLSYRVGAPC